MKRLLMIGGAMGVGKTETCMALRSRLSRNVFLDGDWCWRARPFIVNAETKRMVIDNIAHLLNSFIACSEYENVLFCWVMHEREIIDTLLEKLDIAGVEASLFTLTCSNEALVARLEADISAGIREPDVIQRALDKLEKSRTLDTIIIDNTELSPAQTAEAILRLI